MAIDLRSGKIYGIYGYCQPHALDLIRMNERTDETYTIEKEVNLHE